MRICEHMTKKDYYSLVITIPVDVLNNKYSNELKVEMLNRNKNGIQKINILIDEQEIELKDWMKEAV